MKYNLTQAVAMARGLEKIVKPYGYHIGITGSCLIAGESDNDMDFVCYPAKTEKFYDFMDVVNNLRIAGWRAEHRTPAHMPDDAKEVWKFGNNTTTFDIIFMS